MEKEILKIESTPKEHMKHDLDDVTSHYLRGALALALGDLLQEERILVLQYDETGKDTEQIGHHRA